MEGVEDRSWSWRGALAPRTLDSSHFLARPWDPGVLELLGSSVQRDFVLGLNVEASAPTAMMVMMMMVLLLLLLLLALPELVEVLLSVILPKMTVRAVLLPLRISLLHIDDDVLVFSAWHSLHVSCKLLAGASCTCFHKCWCLLRVPVPQLWRSSADDDASSTLSQDGAGDDDLQLLLDGLLAGGGWWSRAWCVASLGSRFLGGRGSARGLRRFRIVEGAGHNWLVWLRHDVHGAVLPDVLVLVQVQDDELELLTGLCGATGERSFPDVLALNFFQDGGAFRVKVSELWGSPADSDGGLWCLHRCRGLCSQARIDGHAEFDGHGNDWRERERERERETGGWDGWDGVLWQWSAMGGWRGS
mmetsp:Transcript_80123/g.166697  ORF Transcript_80123/g.166697 Transcript_80123/m.166697 type:complete len:360 (-) Transcript_80123:146-1225(-)